MLLGCLLATASVQAAPSSTAPGPLPASPAPITPRTDGLPRELQEWVPWAMQGHEMLACPSRHDQAGSRACVWPEHLAVVIDGRQARFTLTVTVYGAPAAVMLPGEAGSWPTEVRTRQGQTLVVTGGSDQPQVLLPAGQHVLTGTLQWQADPQLVRVPAQVGTLSVVATGKPVAAMMDRNRHVWLKASRPAAEADVISNTMTMLVRRRIDDGVPRQVTTHYELNVAGQPREVELPAALLSNSMAQALRSDLPARLYPNGRLQVQLKPGNWHLEVDARQMQPTTELALPAGAPDEEVWSYEGHNDLHVAQVEGVEAVDAQQARVPEDWRQLPAYRVGAKDKLQLVYRTRGNEHPEASSLKLQRQWWLDFDGQGITQKDVLTGTLSAPWRLQLQGPAQLGHARQGETALPIGLLQPSSSSEQPRDAAEHDAADTAPGVELRNQKLTLTTLARLESRSDTLPANGWNTVLDGVEAKLQLPPGWTLLAASGVDDVTPATWTSRWRLYDFFFMLLIGMAAYRLLRPLPATTVMLAALLSWYDLEGAGVLIILLLVLLACQRVAPKGSAPEKWLQAGNRVLCLFLLLVLAPFAVNEVRLLIYPSLEHARVRDTSGYYYVQAHRPDADGEVATLQKRARSRAMADLSSIDSIDADVARGKAADPIRHQGRIMPVQTGPGEPGWSWNAYTLELHGDVQPDQTVTVHLLPPWGTRILKIVRLLVLFGSLWALYRVLPGGFLPKRPQDPEAGHGMGTASTATTVMLAALTVLTLAWPAQPVQAASGYKAEQLEAIREHLYPAPSCLPHCAAVAQTRVKADAERLTLQLLVHAQATVQVPLPGHDGADNWRLERVLLNGQPATTRREASRQGDGQDLWVLMPAGIHVVELQGTLGQGAHVRLPLPMAPRMLQVDSTVWSAGALNAQGLPNDGVLTLTRKLDRADEPTTKQLAHVPDALPGFALVERTLVMDERWRLETRISRLSVSQAPVKVRFALLPGESVNDDRVLVRDGVAEIELGSARRITLASTLSISSDFVWQALPAMNQIEIWTMRYGTTWHLRWEGMAPTNYVQDGQLAPWWQPWPGERLQVQALQPTTVSGPTLTLQGHVTTLTPGAHSTLAETTLRFRASLAGTQRATLPPGAELLGMRLDNDEVPLQARDGQLELPVIPGEHTVTLRWRVPQGTDGAFNRYETQPLALNLPGVNATTQLNLPESRVVLLVGGTGIGPAVRFWGFFVLLVAVSMVLGRHRTTPLGMLGWLLLLLGVAPISLWGALAVVGWFFALAWLPSPQQLRRLGCDEQAARSTMPFALGLWTLFAAIALYLTIQRSLLGYPDLLVGGNGSTPFELNWYQDRFQNQPDADWAISMSLTAYRTMMLAWSLWLAFSLLGWIRWGWRRLVETGYVGQHPEHPDGTPGGTSGGTGGAKGPHGPHGSGAPGVPGDTKGTDGGSSALSRGRTTATNAAAAASHAVARRDAAPEKVAGPDRSTRQDSVAPAGSVNVAGSTRAETMAAPDDVVVDRVAVESPAADGAAAEQKAAGATAVPPSAREAHAGNAPQAVTSTVSAVRHPAAQGMDPAARPSQPTGALRKLVKVFFWFAAVLGILVMLGLGFVLLNYGRYLF